MRTKKNISRTCMVLLGFVFLACTVSCDLAAPKLPSDFEHGRMDGRTYKNDFLKMEFTAPEGWHIADKALIEDFYGEDEFDIATVACFFKHDPNEADEDASNPQIALLVEAMDNKPVSTDTCVKMLQDTLKSSGSNLKKPVSEKTFGGKTFKLVEIEGVAFYVLGQGRCAVVFSTSGWGNDAERAELESVLDSLKFN